MTDVLQNLFQLAFLLFQVWMFIDALRRGEIIWALFIGLFLLWNRGGVGLSAFLYFFLVYRQNPQPILPKMEISIPALDQKRRIAALEAQIEAMDKPHHHAELAQIYLERGKLPQAEQAFKKAIEGDPDDLDFQAQFGICLSQQERPEEAEAQLRKVVAQEPDHGFGQTQMLLANCLQQQKKFEEATEAWEAVLKQHSYAEARVKLAQLKLQLNAPDRAKALLGAVISDNELAPDYQRKQEREWVNQARATLKKLA